MTKSDTQFKIKTKTYHENVFGFPNRSDTNRDVQKPVTSDLGSREIALFMYR